MTHMTQDEKQRKKEQLIREIYLELKDSQHLADKSAG